MARCYLCGYELPPEDRHYPDVHYACELERLRRVGSGTCVRCGERESVRDNACEMCDEAVPCRNYLGGMLHGTV